MPATKAVSDEAVLSEETCHDVRDRVARLLPYFDQLRSNLTPWNQGTVDYLVLKTGFPAEKVKSIALELGGSKRDEVVRRLCRHLRARPSLMFQRR